MAADEIAVIGGIDTHTDLHQAAVIDTVGRHLATRAFETTPDGYRQMLEWLCSHGELLVVGLEGTGAYGAEAARFLTANGVTVIEVDRPDRKARRDNGKSDPVDAYAAATAVLSGRASGIPKTRDGIVEAIRTLRVARSSAVKARTQAINQIRTLIVTAPATVRERLRGLATGELVDTLARSRPAGDLADPVCAAKITLRRLARRYQLLCEEIAEADADLGPLVTRAAPRLIALPGVGPETAGQLLTSAGDNPDRLKSEASFAHLCGAAPIPASSGRTNRHRLNRGGDRQANRALHTIVLVRMRYDQRTRDYVAKRTTEGMTKKDIIRCLKRFVAREVYKHLPHPRITTEHLIQTT
ncbi:IS110 family transposase [Streptomyces davaonensis JCM 4913]|uniref:IS110 family transposase n=1 Tax=Streptomyces davaonensis (strain DSM 101723 / JCM 4913 / KCC S-0913 / 768) TaxID=1214101 RepID=K4QXJ9_STRDJ|nr:IS110 family transposase [Streptomyces davaonensis]CCK26816.1 IS110 family transposase [Streptomyces davaonensis JCM 4913]CCK28215.1 IS110 family transposase [Streptomyces davaonensis JCM 4913]CCK28781.1 IS110 family transposase [Streptomyces davaonensis JCM 4913]CCK30023.1 IS110 family transposase [Streptomyces davaonensis JCM 4913]